MSKLTDEDVLKQIERDYSSVDLKRALAGIFRCRRAAGDSVDDAWIFALKEHINAHITANSTS